MSACTVHCEWDDQEEDERVGSHPTSYAEAKKSKGANTSYQKLA